MTDAFFKGMHILAVDDEWDVIETIQEILGTAVVDVARTHDTALEKIQETRYELAILDIMGVEGFKLLEACVKRSIPAVMLTAHVVSPKTLMDSIKKGAISYLPKEHLADLPVLLKDLLEAKDRGTPTWKILFDRLEADFDLKFGENWKSADPDFWTDFERYWDLSRGIQERLRHDPDIVGKGI